MSNPRTPPTPEQLDTARDHAVDALAGAICRDRTRVTEAVDALNKTGMLLWAMTGWVDASASAAADRAGLSLTDLANNTVFVPVACDADGTPQNIDDQDPRHVWAMRMYTARVANDKDTWDAVLATAPDNAGPYISALLIMCADMVSGDNHAVFETREVTGL